MVNMKTNGSWAFSVGDEIVASVVNPVIDQIAHAQESRKSEKRIRQETTNRPRMMPKPNHKPKEGVNASSPSFCDENQQPQNATA